MSNKEGSVCLQLHRYVLDCEGDLEILTSHFLWEFVTPFGQKRGLIFKTNNNTIKGINLDTGQSHHCSISELKCHPMTDEHFVSIWFTDKRVRLSVCCVTVATPLRPVRLAPGLHKMSHGTGDFCVEHFMSRLQFGYTKTMRGLQLVVLWEIQRRGHKTSSVSLCLMCCTVELHNRAAYRVE